MKRTVLIDGNAICYWRHFAREKDPHRPGAVQWIRRFLDDAQPDRAVIALDGVGNWRKAKHPVYKMHRPPTPDGVRNELRALMDSPLVQRVDEYEADDVIATVARKNPDTQHLVVTNDKDMLQLVSDNVVCYDPKMQIAFDTFAVFEKWGVWPPAMRSLLALMGDAADGIDGVPGFGPAFASKVVNAFDWEPLWSTLGATEQEVHVPVSKSKRDLLRQFRAIAVRNYELVALSDVPGVA